MMNIRKVKLFGSLIRGLVAVCLVSLLAGCSTPMVKDRFKKEEKEKVDVEKVEQMKAAYREADRLYKIGNLPMAEQKYLEVVALDDTNADAHYRLGNIAFRRADFKRASDHFTKAIKHSPRSKKAHYNLAITYLTLSEQHFQFFSSLADQDTDLTKVSQILADIYEFASGDITPRKQRQSVRRGATNSRSATSSRGQVQQSGSRSSSRSYQSSDTRRSSSSRSTTTRPATTKGSSGQSGVQEATIEALDSLVDQF